MEYISKETKSSTINNAEFVLLMLIDEKPSINGYNLRRTVEERGYRAWAGVASSSIYVVLKKLEERSFVVSALDDRKTSKGPKGKLFRIDSRGKRELLKTIEIELSGSLEHDSRYNIALSGLSLLKRDKLLGCFDLRRNFLANEIARIDVLSNMPNLSLDIALLFDRILSSMRSELEWVKRTKLKLAKTYE